jgi:hypothetical protein
MSLAAVLVAVAIVPLLAQQPDKPIATVPRLVRVNGTFHTDNGLPVGTTESATLSIYREEQGGTPLWQETQNVGVDAEGHYTAMLGITLKDGVPVDLFSTNEPRWLGVQFNRPGETEQSRVQLVSVPYALKASDAETLGGRPASAYLLDPNAVGSGDQTSSSISGGRAAVASLPNPKSLKPHSITGSMNYIPYFTDNSNDLGNSNLYQNGGNIGVGTTSPMGPLHIAMTPNQWSSWNYGAGLVLQTPGKNTALALLDAAGANPWAIANVYSPPTLGTLMFAAMPALGTTTSPASPVMSLTQAGNVGIGTTTPGSKLDVAGNINFSGALSYQGAPVLNVPGDGGYNSIAIGRSALSNNTTGHANTATGSNTLQSNSIGSNNTATGYATLKSNVDGNANTATGSSALLGNTSGGGNTATGAAALWFNTTGSDNTASGYGALSNNTTGSNNIAVGWDAGFNVVVGSNNIHIGGSGSADESGTIRVGTPGTQTSFYAAGIYGMNSSGIPVYINSNGRLGTVGSSRRYKEDIQDMGDASSGLMRLRPVTFRYKKGFEDGSKPIQYGLIAEEVAEVYPDLVAHSADGQIETVKYQLLDSMLLNETQKQQREIATLKDQNQSLQNRLARLEETMEKITAGVQ